MITSCPEFALRARFMSWVLQFIYFFWFNFSFVMLSWRLFLFLFSCLGFCAHLCSSTRALVFPNQLARPLVSAGVSLHLVSCLHLSFLVSLSLHHLPLRPLSKSSLFPAVCFAAVNIVILTCVWFVLCLRFGSFGIKLFFLEWPC